MLRNNNNSANERVPYSHRRSKIDDDNMNERLERPEIKIPEGYDLKKIVEQLLLELWMYNSLDQSSLRRIIDKGRN